MKLFNEILTSLLSDRHFDPMRIDLALEWTEEGAHRDALLTVKEILLDDKLDNIGRFLRVERIYRALRSSR